ncbi:hypothetical protein Lal_00036302 [Lupinus albus]|nr:hypothetical protein Lal_00036302 [Lupinus albus]
MNIFINKLKYMHADSSVRRFNVLKSDWGVSKFMDYATLKGTSRGYMINDTCVFGVSVFIFNTIFRGECLSMIEKPVCVSHSWKFNNFSIAELDYYEFYPTGNVECNYSSISLFLYFNFSALSTSSNRKLYVEFTLRAKDQNNGKHSERKAFHDFSNSSSIWGFSEFFSLAKFIDAKRGFLVKDCCILEADVKVLGVAKLLPK